MKDKYLEHIIKEAILELQQDKNDAGVNVELAQQLINDPNNEVVWRVFKPETEDSIFANGNSAEWFGTGEGDYHGTGTYCFYKPYGAEKRWGGARIGSKIMKCVVIGGFKDFLILDAPMALKYYKSDDIRTQLSHLYSDEKLRNEILTKYVSTNGSTKLRYHSTTGFISKALYDEFKNRLRNGLTRGVVYNGGNDPHAALVYDPRTVIPIAVTNERYLNASKNDFDGWKVRLTSELFDKISNEKDFFSYGEKLKAQGKIKDYSKMPPQNDCLFVVMPNGKYSAYNVVLNKFVSNYGFDQCIGWEMRKVTKNGEEIQFPMLPVIADRKKFLLRYNPRDENYVFYNESTIFKPYMSLKRYDSLSHQQTLNESINDNYLTVYHRTDRDSVDGIFAGGFSKEYTGKKANQAGPGIYFTFSPEESTRLTYGFGPVMLKCRLENGLKNYLVPQGFTILGKTYDKPLIEQLLELTYPKFRDEIYQKYGRVNDTQALHIYLCKSGDLGKTKVRGILYPYRGGIAAVASDWGSIIPYEYSTDDGRTWHNGTDEEKLNFIKSHGDAKFALNKFIANGIIENTFGNNQNDIAANQQYNHGFLRVILKKNKKVSYYNREIDDLISYEGFDNSISPEIINDNGEKIIVIPVIINGETYQVRKIENEYYLFKEGPSYQIYRMSDGTPWDTDLYDRVMEYNKSKKQ